MGALDTVGQCSLIYLRRNLSDEYTAFMPAIVVAVVHAAKDNPTRIDEFDSDFEAAAQNLADIPCLRGSRPRLPRHT
jgi:hypothetical protein